MKRSITTALSVGLVLSLSTLLLFSSQWGMKWLVHTLVPIPSANLSIGKISGSLFGSVQLHDVRYVSTPMEVQLAFAEVELALLALIRARLHLLQLNADQIQIRMTDRSSDETAPTPQLAVPLFNAIIEQVKAENINIAVASDKTLILRSVLADNVRVFDKLYMDKLSILGLHHELNLSGQLGFAADKLVNLRANWRSLSEPANTPSLNLAGTLVGTFEQLRFLLESPATGQFRIEGIIHHLLDQPRWQWQARFNSVSLKSLNPQWPEIHLQGQLHSEGDSAAFDLKGHTQLQYKQFSPWENEWQGQYHARQLILNVSNTQRNQSKKQAHISVTGNFTHQEDLLAWQADDIDITWDNVALPDQGQPIIASSHGELQINKSRQRLRLISKDIDYVPLGLQLREIQLSDSNNHPGQLYGSFNSAQGNAQLRAHIQFGNELPFVQFVELSGSQLAMIRTPDAHIVGSPQLSITRRQNGDFITQGTVDVSMANIRFPGFYNNFSQYWPFSGHYHADRANPLKLRFGNNVWMHGYGLNARISGELTLVTDVNREFSASGQLDVKQGRLVIDESAYPLQSGNLRFQDRPLINPSVNLLSQTSNARPSVLKIEGSLQAPRLVAGTDS